MFEKSTVWAQQVPSGFYYILPKSIIFASQRDEKGSEREKACYSNEQVMVESESHSPWCSVLASALMTNVRVPLFLWRLTRYSKVVWGVEWAPSRACRSVWIMISLPSRSDLLYKWLYHLD